MHGAAAPPSGPTGGAVVAVVVVEVGGVAVGVALGRMTVEAPLA